MEKQYKDVTEKITLIEQQVEEKEKAIDQKIGDIQKLQSANDKKLKEVTYETYKNTSSMSDDEVASGWDNFMSDVRKRNSDRNIR